MDHEVVLPGMACAFPLGAARFQEIKALEYKLAQCEHGARAFQRLPRHMQRRAVSSNPQRLPRSLQEKHQREIGSKLKVAKRPCRKYRRRPTNLLAEYSRRQRNNVWLETHIWFAKRFHMTKQWGYCLPKCPTTKGYRATLRAATESCLIQDVSYENCIECEAPFTKLTKVFDRIISSEDKLALFDQKALKGLVWVKVMLHAPDKIPYGAIGDVQVLWLPCTQNSTRCIWMWLHPSVHEEVLTILILLFDLDRVTEVDAGATVCTQQPDHVLASKLTHKNVPFVRTPRFVSKYDKDINVALLKDTLNKFKLIGPQSYDVLRKSIIPSMVSVHNSAGGNNQTEETPDAERGCLLDSEERNLHELDSDRQWWKKFYSEASNLEANSQQSSYWQSVSTEDLKCKQIIGLVMRDPRLILPVHKQALNDPGVPASQTQTPEFYQHPLFNAKMRDCVTCSMKSTHEVNTMRSQLLVPGTPYPLTDDESRIPVMLLYHPSSHVCGLGDGWEVILPCGWGSQTWVTMIMNGAVAGGQDQAETLISEFLTPLQPHMLPDTTAGQVYASNLSREKEIQYFKRPPNCRFNFIKLGIRNPFGVSWTELIEYWQGESSNYFVLRDKNILNALVSITCKKIEKIKNVCARKRVCDDGEKVEPASKHFKAEDYEKPSVSTTEETILKTEENKKPPVSTTEVIGFQVPPNSLIYVRLIVIGKGNLEPLARICLPSLDDLNSLSEELKTHGNPYSYDVVEPVHEDVNAEVRSSMKKEHKRCLIRVRRKRKEARTKVLTCEEDPLQTYSTIKEAMAAAVKEVEEKEKNLIEEIAAYQSKMNNLWINLKNGENKDCIRETIGYVTDGRFCQRMGRAGGVGWVVAKPFVSLLLRLNLLAEVAKDSPLMMPVYGPVPGNTKDCNNEVKFKQVYVLVRNCSSFHYRWARLVVLNEPL